jgi:two-component system sensor histidine kinase/response regulator
MIAAAAATRPYDVVILDLQMPGMDGHELARAIRHEPGNAGLPLILMTSTAQLGQASQAHAVGISGYLKKPVRQAQLYDCLRAVLGARDPAPPGDLGAAPVPTIVTAHSLKEAVGLGRPRVLLAEDNKTNQLAAVRMLEKLGYQVDVAINGLEAVAACRRIDYGIVLMDNQMPEMDGRTATREIRRFELAQGRPPVAIIAVTADAMQGERERSLAAGMNDYLSKPFKAAQLGEILERWAPVLAGVWDLPTDRAIDSRMFDDFRGTGAGANDFVVDLIEAYLSDSTARMADLDEAAARHDAGALQVAAHALKGSSSAVGAAGMAAICDHVESQARTPGLVGLPASLLRLREEYARVRAALRIEQTRAA